MMARRLAGITSSACLPPRNDGRKTQAGLPTQPAFIIFDSFQRLLHLG
jgi:hypothetical protein